MCQHSYESMSLATAGSVLHAESTSSYPRIRRLFFSKKPHLSGCLFAKKHISYTQTMMKARYPVTIELFQRVRKHSNVFQSVTVRVRRRSVLSRYTILAQGGGTPLIKQTRLAVGANMGILALTLILRSTRRAPLLMRQKRATG